jgi:hypothetical protein
VYSLTMDQHGSHDLEPQTVQLRKASRQHQQLTDINRLKIITDEILILYNRLYYYFVCQIDIHYQLVPNIRHRCLVANIILLANSCVSLMLCGSRYLKHVLMGSSQFLQP